MSLNSRVAKLEGQAVTRRKRKLVPTDSLESFTRGWLTGEFTVDDIDPTDFDHTTLLSRLAAYLVTLTPEHQAFLDANPWAQQCVSETEKTLSALFGREPVPR